MSFFGNSIIASLSATNGYIKFANGEIVQWGAYTGAAQDPTLNFPIAFPTACRSVVAVITGYDTPAAQLVSVNTFAKTTTQFSVRQRVVVGGVAGQAAFDFDWFARGN